MGSRTNRYFGLSVRLTNNNNYWLLSSPLSRRKPFSRYLIQFRTHIYALTTSLENVGPETWGPGLKTNLEEERSLYFNSLWKRDRNWSRAFNRRLANCPTLGGGGKISILSSFGNEIVIGAGPSTGDWPTARHLEEERYLYISSFGNEIVIIKKILNWFPFLRLPSLSTASWSVARY